MCRVGRSGFTLVELVVSMALLGIVLAGIYQAIAATQQTTGLLVQRMDVQQNTRAAALYLTRILRELNSTDGDIVVADPTTLRIRGMQWTSVICSTPNVGASRVRFTVNHELLFGPRSPDTDLDSIFVYAEKDASVREDDAWLAGGLMAASGDSCDDGTAGTRLDVNIAASSGGNLAALDSVTFGAPVRGFQMEEYSLYSTEGKMWLGQRSANRGGSWTDVRALVGPLTIDGLTFQYSDRNGAITASPQSIATIGLSIHGQSYAPVGSFGYVLDSVITRIGLRNNARY